MVVAGRCCCGAGRGAGAVGRVGARAGARPADRFRGIFRGKSFVPLALYVFVFLRGGCREEKKFGTTRVRRTENGNRVTMEALPTEPANELAGAGRVCLLREATR